MPMSERSTWFCRISARKWASVSASPGSRSVTKPSPRSRSAGEPDRAGHGLLDQGVERRQPERLQHRRDVVGPGPDVAVDEGVGGREEGGDRVDGGHRRSA